MNPYWGNDFFQFFSTLFRRLTGKIPLNELASDEVQLLALSGIGIAAALIGVFLTLKKMTMLANSLSHTSLPAIALVYIATVSTTGHFEISLTTLLIASFVSALATAALTYLLTHVTKLQEDASIGLVFTALFAAGVVLVTVYTRSAHIGVEAVIGNADALHPDDLKIIGATLGFNILFISCFYRQLKITTFDPTLASAVGIFPFLFNNLLLLATAATAVAAFRAVGVILVLALFVTPALFARYLTHRLGAMIALSLAFAVFFCIVSVALSRHLLSRYALPLSTGGIVVTLMGLFYLLTLTKDKGLMLLKKK